MSGSQRSRLGCKQCKKSKVKCDELKPSCRKCLRKSIPCEYGTPIQWVNVLNQGVIWKDSKIIRKKITKKAQPGKAENLFVNQFQKLKPYGQSNFTDNQLLSDSTSLITKIDDDIHSKTSGRFDLNSLITPSDLNAFEFYCKFTAHLVVIAPSTEFVNENPFITIISKNALKNQGLMAVVVAYALKHKGLILNKEFCSSIMVDELLRISKNKFESLNEFLIDEFDSKVLIGLMFTSYQLFAKSNDPDFTYLNSTKTLLLKKLNSNYDIHGTNSASATESVESPFMFFVLRWLSYLDIIVPLMSSEKSFKTIRKIECSEVWKCFTVIEPFQKVDMILGFNIKFLWLFDELIQMIEKKNCIAPEKLQLQAGFWKTRFTYIYGSVTGNSEVINGDCESDCESHKTLDISYKLFYHAGLIQLYRRVLDIPKTSKIVQDSCNLIKGIFKENIELGSSLESCSIFALFIAGSEIADEDSRNLIKKRLSHIGFSGNMTAFHAIKVLETSWRTGKMWTEISDEAVGCVFYLF